MYSLVLMTAMTSGAEAPTFGGKGGFLGGRRSGSCGCSGMMVYHTPVCHPPMYASCGGFSFGGCSGFGYGGGCSGLSAPVVGYPMMGCMGGVAMPAAGAQPPMTGQPMAGQPMAGQPMTGQPAANPQGSGVTVNQTPIGGGRPGTTPPSGTTPPPAVGTTPPPAGTTPPAGVEQVPARPGG